MNTTVSIFFILTCLTTVAIFFLNLFFNDYTNYILSFNQTHAINKEIESCDLFKGRWIRDPNASLYSNYSCATIPWSKNCLLHGKDGGFLNWKWKPDGCELPRFSAVTFLSILRGKKMAFIGDSLARNQFDSLVCLLSTVETPESKDKSEDDRFITWEFREHDFTLTVFWSPFLVAARSIAGTHGFDLHVDRAGTEWSEKLPSVDYAVFSATHWLLKRNYLYEDGHVIGCTKCRKPNTTVLGPGRAIRVAFRAALRAVNGCEDCKKIVSFVRAGSPAHFENGSWKNGGRCTRTRPVEREELDRAKPDWGYSKIILEEVERAKIEGKEKGNEFEFLDVTEMMAPRVDGHPDQYWGSKGGSDCLHWCLPGPIDTWNELLLERFKRLDNRGGEIGLLDTGGAAGTLHHF